MAQRSSALEQWPCYLQGPGFKSHLRPVDFFSCNKVSPLNNQTPTLRSMPFAPINNSKPPGTQKKMLVKACHNINTNQNSSNDSLPVIIARPWTFLTFENWILVRHTATSCSERTNVYKIYPLSSLCIKWLRKIGEQLQQILRTRELVMFCK